MTDVDDLIKMLREHDAKLAARGFSASWVRGHSLEAAAALERLKAALERYLTTCTNDECVYCIAARRALKGETR